MHRPPMHLLALLALLTGVFVATPLHAQRPVSLGLAAGISVGGHPTAVRNGGPDSQWMALLEVDSGDTPVDVRLDLIWVDEDYRDRGSAALTLDLVLPIGGARGVQPYVLLGPGRYGIGKGDEAAEWGFTAGAGLALRVERAPVRGLEVGPVIAFGELRFHSAFRSAVLFGLRI